MKHIKIGLEKEIATIDPIHLPNLQMKLNVKISFNHTNSLGTKIYHEPIGRHVYKIGEYPTPFEKLPWVD